MRFFLDRNISLRLARLIEVFDREHQVEHHDSHFGPMTTDIEWLSRIQEWNPRPVVVSGDLQILRNKAESQVLRESGLTFFALESAWPKLTWDEQAWKFIKVWPRVRDRANAPRPTVFTVPVSASKVDELCPTMQLGHGHRRV